jgi:hypothetical protein
MEETREEHDKRGSTGLAQGGHGRSQSQGQGQGQAQGGHSRSQSQAQAQGQMQDQGKYVYNPQDYVSVQQNYQSPPYPNTPPAGGFQHQQTYQGQR